jgi:hypothetical protein
MLLSFGVLNKEQAVQLCTLIGFRMSHVGYMVVFKKGAHIWLVYSKSHVKLVFRR